mgnify:CR=1 FL=1
MIEKWKYIPDATGYRVSNLGRAKDSRGRELIAVPSEQFHGTMMVAIKKDDARTRSRMSLWRLVAEAFVLNPDGFKFFTHLDGDRTNCAADNLQWIERRPKGEKTEKKKAEHKWSLINDNGDFLEIPLELIDDAKLLWAMARDGA